MTTKKITATYIGTTNSFYTNGTSYSLQISTNNNFLVKSSIQIAKLTGFGTKTYRDIMVLLTEWNNIKNG